MPTSRCYSSEYGRFVYGLLQSSKQLV